MQQIICVRCVDQRRERVCSPIRHHHFHHLSSIVVVGRYDDDDDGCGCGYDPCAWRMSSLFQMMMMMILVQDDEVDADYDVILMAERMMMMMMMMTLLSLCFFPLDLEEKDSISCCGTRMRTRRVPGCASADSDL